MKSPAVKPRLGFKEEEDLEVLIREVDEYDPKALVKPTASDTLAAKWEAGKGRMVRYIYIYTYTYMLILGIDI